MRRRAVCGELMRRYEKPGREAVPDYLTCGRRPGHPGRHESTLYVRARSETRQPPTGSPALAAAIRQARVQAGWSQYRLAAAASVSRSAVQSWEDARRTPGEQSWIQLELALGPLGVIRGQPAHQQPATEETTMQRDDPAELVYPDADGAGWDALALRELDEAVRLGDLAQRMLRVSARLAAAVLNRDQPSIGRIIGGLTPDGLSEDVRALLVVQAGLIAGAGAHATTDGLLAWVDFDEHGQALPCKVAPVIPLPGTGEHADAA